MKISTVKEKALILAAIAAFCGGSIVIAVKIALEVFEPFTIVFLRFLSATILLAPLVLKKGDFKFKSISRFIPVGVIGALNPILLFIALQFTQASVSPLIYAAVPALTALYLYFYRGEKVSKNNILGMTVGFFGVFLIIMLPIFEKDIPLAALTGNILIFAAAIAFMFYGIISKKQQEEFKASPVTLTFYFALIALLLSIPFSLYEIKDGFLGVVKMKHVLAGIYTGVVGTVFFYITYQYALKLGSEVAASLFTYLQPIVTILLSAIFLGERITATFIVGGILAVVGAKVASKK